MLKQRIYVSVVGFSDVERHALNTIFRLSEERELSYAPWVPLVAPGATPRLMTAEVLLVDGESAEAVLSHARETPSGQRLIWIGHDAPEYAWRVMQRPIQWANLLHDLDAVYAARQVDSGYLDLDVTSPAPLGADPMAAQPPERRALLLGADRRERDTLRLRLNAVGVTEIDEVGNTESAVELIGRHAYCCGVFNLDDQHLDAWSLVRLLADSNPQALTIGLSEHAGPLAAWWSRRRVRRDTRRAGITALLARPLQTDDLMPWVDRLRD
ncbi:MAG: hypothetical protein C0443_09185 [Comamonadaceae bacterium]|nr:hypothetical protein [Comamonadaceae bacterium]